MNSKGNDLYWGTSLSSFFNSVEEEIAILDLFVPLIRFMIRRLLRQSRFMDHNQDRRVFYYLSDGYYFSIAN